MVLSRLQLVVVEAQGDRVRFKHVVDDCLDGKFLVRRELSHRVVLLVENGHIDVLVADICDFVCLLEEAAPSLGERDSARQLILNHLQVFALIHHLLSQIQCSRSLSHQVL